jgi:hypothetical protein
VIVTNHAFAENSHFHEVSIICVWEAFAIAECGDIATVIFDGNILRRAVRQHLNVGIAYSVLTVLLPPAVHRSMRFVYSPMMGTLAAEARPRKARASAYGENIIVRGRNDGSILEGPI